MLPKVLEAIRFRRGILLGHSDGASIDVLCSALAIQKSFTGNTNGTDPDLGVPSANIGDTLHYTLHYTGAGPIALRVYPGGPGAFAPGPLLGLNDVYFDTLRLRVDSVDRLRDGIKVSLQAAPTNPLRMFPRSKTSRVSWIARWER